MTDRLTVPQSGDFVSGQNMTEPGQKLLNDMADKLEVLENASTDVTTEDIESLQEQIETLETEVSTKPKITVLTGLSVEPLEDGFDVYHVVCEFRTTSGGSGNICGIRQVSPTNGPTNLAIVQIPANDGTTEIAYTLSASLGRDTIREATDSSLEVYGDRTIDSAQWTIFKYNTGA